MSFDFDIDACYHLLPDTDQHAFMYGGYLMSFGRNYAGLNLDSEQSEVITGATDGSLSIQKICQLFGIKGNSDQIYVETEYNARSGLMTQRVWLIFNSNVAIEDTIALKRHVLDWPVGMPNKETVLDMLLSLRYDTVMQAARRAELHLRDTSV
jgi:hypothetical protein